MYVMFGTCCFISVEPFNFGYLLGTWILKIINSFYLFDKVDLHMVAIVLLFCRLQLVGL